jgi:hypothetical protein
LSKLIAYISSFVTLFLIIGVISYFRYYGPAGGFLHHDLDAASVVRDVQQLNDLVTVRYVVQKVVGMTQDAAPIGSESILLMVEGRVSAGVKLNEVNQYSVESLGPGHVKLRLPPPQILDAYINEKNTKVWDRHVTWWTPWVAPDPNLEHKARLQAINDIEQAALETGILDNARRNAREAIRKFLGAFGINSVEFSEAKSVS